MTISVGKRQGNALVPYSQATRRTKIIDLVAGDITAGSGLSNIDLKRGWIQCYTDSNNKWIAEGKIVMTADVATARDTIKFALAGILSDNTATNYQRVGMDFDDSNLLVRSGYSGISNNEFTAAFTTTTSTSYSTKYLLVDFKILLKEEPTTYTTAANMESVTDASIYIEPASATQAGLQPAGIGTTVAGTSTSQVLTTSPDTYTDADSISLTAGTWIVYGQGVAVTGSAASQYLNLRIYNNNDSSLVGEGVATQYISANTEPIAERAKQISISGVAVIPAGETHTVKLQIRSSGSGIGLSGESLTVGLTDPDNKRSFYAVRIA